MDYLCQQINGNYTTWIVNTCHCDWMNILISLFATYIAVLLIAYLRWIESNREPLARKHIRQNHNFRTVSAILLFLTHCAEMADAFLSGGPGHVYTVSAVSITLLILLLILCHLIERTRHPALLFLVGFLWFMNGITRSIRFGILYHIGVGMDKLRPSTAVSSSILYYTVSVSELITASKEIVRFRRGNRDNRIRIGIQSYRHDDVHFLSKATFYWMNSLLKSGYKSPIELEDLGVLPEAHSAKHLHQQLEDIMLRHKEPQEMNPGNLWKIFLIFMRHDFFIGGVFKLLGDLSGIVGPLGISVMVSFVADAKNGDTNVQNDPYPSVIHLWENGWTIAFIVFFASIAQSTFSQASTHIINVRSIHLKVALQSLIYKRSLLLKTSAKCGLQHLSKQNDSERKSDEESTYFGFLVNLMSNDATNVMSFFWISHYIWAIPVKMSVIMFLMYMKLGASAIVGAAGTILVLMPLQLFIGKKMSKNSSAILELSDERLQHLSILIEKIKLFKLLGWENYYCRKILDIRSRELQLLDRDSAFWAVLTFFTHASSLLVSLIIFGVNYMISDAPLASDAVFATLALINQLMVPLFIFPVIIPTIAEALVSCRRISEFFRLPEVKLKREIMNGEDCTNGSKMTSGNSDMSTKMSSINEEDENRLLQEMCNMKVVDGELNSKNTDCLQEVIKHWKNVSDNTGQWVLAIDKGVFSWSPECPQKTLSVDKIRIPSGGIIAIIGKVGSGKTSLLSAILGEIEKISGKIMWRRNVSIAYCPQSPWLLNSTIRENILFGLPFRYRRYDQVVEACALKPDLDILPKKDLTEIGEKGINLSGGQKQRIAIARALYSRANLVILDDPLSSLDQSTALTIFEDGIKQLVGRSKRTVILSTHNLQLLSDCHLVIAMEEMKIKAQGTPNEIKISLLNNWKDLCSTSTESTPKEHTAKERWQLIKSVAKIRRSLRVKDAENNPWFAEDNTSMVIGPYQLDMDSLFIDQQYIPSGKNRKLFDGCSEWNYIIHDLPLPTDEFRSKIVRYGSVMRKNSVRKKEIGRARSLQDRHTKAFQVVRQYSSPLSNDTDKQLRTERKCRRELIGHFLNGHYGVQLDGKVENKYKSPLSTVSSTEMGVGDLFSDDSDENDEELGNSFASKGVEEREYGKMRNRVYVSYLMTCGVKAAIAYLLVTLAWQIVRVNTDFWLSVWIETSETDGVLKYLSIYASLSVGAVVLSLLSHGLGQYAGSQARKTLHDSMLLNIIKCPNKLFECTPAGRIFNRFSADIEVVDKKLATTIQRLMQFLLLCCSSIVINAVITPWFIVTAIPLALLYYIIQMFYRCSSRELQRIDSITRSPMFSHFAETLSGVSSIRAFGSEGKFISSFYTKVNLNTNTFLILNSTNRWLGIVLDYLGGIIVLLAMITALVAVQLYPDSVTPSLVGLAMNYTLLVPIYLNWVVKFFVDCEIYLGAVERIKKYIILPTEEYNPLSEEDQNESLDISKSGDIKFENVTLSYGSRIEPALTGINLHIPPGQKIGICGRSGSGKSTLALSLFNMLEIHEGCIRIDGLDITKIPLHSLRTRGSIIPQDALLFNGTIRENLDASGVCTEEQLWSAVDRARLKEIIETQYHGNLDAEMNAGQSMSGGQKQLFSLARAILQKSSFLVMDEATSNLDKESEQILMSTAQEIFAGKTLLIIAHRLSTVLDCDRIIVLDRGKIVEDGTPGDLMNKNKGIFSEMVKSSDEGFLVP